MTKEESLKMALNEARCPELPRQLAADEKRFWIYAIIQVRKRNLTEAFTLAKRRGDGSFVYTHDFGAISPIVGTISIHPYIYLEEHYLFKDKTDSEKRNILRQCYPDKIEVIDSADEATITNLMVEHGIKLQTESITSKDILEDIAEYVQEAEKNAEDTGKSNADIPAANRARKTPKVK